MMIMTNDWLLLMRYCDCFFLSESPGVCRHKDMDLAIGTACKFKVTRVTCRHKYMDLAIGVLARSKLQEVTSLFKTRLRIDRT